MLSRRDHAGRIVFAARLLLKDLLRRRITVLLLFAVPALFDAVVLATTGRRDVEVTIATLVDDGARIRVPGMVRNPFDVGLLDDGFRKLDQRSLSLVFLGTAAVSFLASFLAFYLVHKRRDADARLVQAGYPVYAVLVAKLMVLLLLVAMLAVYEAAIVFPWVTPLHFGWLAAGFLLGGLVYGCLGLLVGAVTGHFPTQLALAGAFADSIPDGLVARSLAWAGGALVATLLAFGLRIRPPRQTANGSLGLRWHYFKVLSIAYAVWILAFQLVGRVAQMLPASDLTTVWDRAIPLVPAFIWPYEACYFLPLLALFVLVDWHRFNIALLAILLANLAAFVLYVTMPVAFPHPDLGGTLAERVLAFEYAADFTPGANKLPSMHVAMAWIIACAMLRQRGGPLVSWLVLAIGSAISVATLFVKQHIVLDVVTGVPLGLIAWWLSRRLYWRLVDPQAAPGDGLKQMLDPHRWWALVRPAR
jgi:hypothetical protein